MEVNENQSVKNRIIEFSMLKNISIHKFEMSIGVSNGYIKNLKAQPGEDIIRKILLKYPELNRVWLLTGEGEMLRAETQCNSGTADSSRTDRLIESNLELIRQHGELIRQQGELIEMLKKLQQQD